MEFVIFISIFAGIILAIGVIAYLAWVGEKKRTEQLIAAAENLGLQMMPEGSELLLDQLVQFQLFNQGHSRKMRNLISGETDEVSISIFDYQYTVGSGKSSQTHSMTVSAIKSPFLTGPIFSIRPETLMDKFGSLLGFQDINFESHPIFSKMYVLKGADEEAIREFMPPALLEFFEMNPGLTVVAEHETLLFYRAGKKIAPDELKDFFATSYEIYGRVIDAVGKSRTG